MNTESHVFSLCSFFKNLLIKLTRCPPSAGKSLISLSIVMTYLPKFFDLLELPRFTRTRSWSADYQYNKMLHLKRLYLGEIRNARFDVWLNERVVKYVADYICPITD